MLSMTCHLSELYRHVSLWHPSGARLESIIEIDAAPIAHRGLDGFKHRLTDMNRDADRALEVQIGSWRPRLSHERPE